MLINKLLKSRESWQRNQTTVFALRMKIFSRESCSRVQWEYFYGEGKKNPGGCNLLHLGFHLFK